MTSACPLGKVSTESPGPRFPMVRINLQNKEEVAQAVVRNSANPKPDWHTCICRRGDLISSLLPSIRSIAVNIVNQSRVPTIPNPDIWEREVINRSLKYNSKRIRMLVDHSGRLVGVAKKRLHKSRCRRRYSEIAKGSKVKVLLLGAMHFHPLKFIHNFISASTAPISEL